MKNWLNIIKTLFITYYAYMLEYRAELFLWALSGSLPFILMGIWMEAADQGATNNFSSVQFARYFLAAFIVRQFNVVWVIWEFEKEVIQGLLSFRLLQPLDPGWHHFMSHFSERFARFPFVIGLILLFFALYPQSFWLPSFSNLLLSIIIITLGFSLRFLIQYTLALFAFWLERASALEDLWFLWYLFLSGMIAPLDVFPEKLRAIIEWTPFPYFIYFPSALLIGLPVNIIKGLAVIIGWILIFFVFNRWLWKKGLKQYSGMGA